MAVIIWSGATNSNWNTGTNWVGNSTPGDTDIATFDSSSAVNCTIDSPGADVLGIVLGTTGSLYTGTLDAATFDVALGTSGLDCTFGGSATLDLGTGTWTITDGTFDYSGIGALDDGTSTVVFEGTCDWTGKDVPLRNVIYASGSDVTCTDNVRVVNSASHYGELTLSPGVRLLYLSNVDVHFNDGTIIDGTGFIEFSSTGGGHGIKTFHANADISVPFRITSALSSGEFAPSLGYPATRISPVTNTTVLSAGDYEFESMHLTTTTGNDGTLDVSAATSCTVTGELLVTRNNNGNITVDGNGGSCNWTLQGDVTQDGIGSGTFTWLPGNGTITLSGLADQDIDFAGETIEDFIIDKSDGTVWLFGDMSPKSFTGTAGTFDPAGVAIDVLGDMDWASGFDFNPIADTMNGSAWTVGGNFTADGQTLNSESPWTLAVVGTAVASGVGSVEYSDASGGTEIDASAGPWVEGGNLNNVNWNFGAIMNQLQGSNLGADLFNGTLI